VSVKLLEADSRRFIVECFDTNLYRPIKKFSGTPDLKTAKNCHMHKTLPAATEIETRRDETLIGLEAVP